MSDEFDPVDEPTDLDPLMDADADELDLSELTDEFSPSGNLADDEELTPEPYEASPAAAVPAQTRAALADLREHGEQSTPRPERAFNTLEEFVNDYLLFWYRRRITANSGAWCPQWWRHPEVMLRFNELWRAFEHLRQDDATGVAVWIRDFVDPFMNVLLSSDGPMAGCTCDRGHSEHTPDPLPSEPIPTKQRIDLVAGEVLAPGGASEGQRDE